ncbi:esterase family protein [Rhodococcus sp. MTM3W5.2]|uniref:enterochelin esterase n=1 Tax=Rhodococcus sp. MTM3W5.2 TaxID=1805827 RepID=UPI0009796441|nr:enterochelin esterase [Rhodococcus sp. MTM3W5.2]AQA21172.1 esterase family protein [Rhodococcus sp. MTM3W5.2]
MRRRFDASGGPLVGPGPPGHVTATFIWRRPPGSPVRHVYLDANGITDRNCPDRNALTPVPGTDLWALSIQVPEQWRGGYGFLPRVDPITRPEPGQTEWQWWRGVLAGLVVDDGNPLPTTATMGQPARSEAVMPGANPQRWWGPARAEPRGTMRCEARTLAGVSRRMWTYEPPGLPADDRPVALLFDGQVTALETPLAPALDLLADRGHRVPLVVMVDSIGPERRSIELTCNADFLAALTDDLLPSLRADLAVTADPRSVLVAGTSYGGLAATYAALHAPGHIGGAVSLSGSFWLPGPQMSGHPVQEQIGLADDGEARFWMAAGTLEPRLIEQNRQVRDLLRAKGFDVDYREFCGGHDYIHWRDGLVEGIATLLGTVR